MDILEYFILPGAIFSTGLIIWLLLGVSARNLELSKGEIQIGKMDKQVLIHLSPEQRKAIKRMLLSATFVCSIVPSAAALLLIKLSPRTLSMLFLCFAVQLLLFLICGTPFYKKMCSMVQTGQSPSEERS